MEPAGRQRSVGSIAVTAAPQLGVARTPQQSLGRRVPPGGCQPAALGDRPPHVGAAGTRGGVEDGERGRRRWWSAAKLAPRLVHDVRTHDGLSDARGRRAQAQHGGDAPAGQPTACRCRRSNVLRLGTCIGAEHEHPVALCRHERREAQRISRPWAQHQLKETVRTRHTRAESEQNGGQLVISRKR